MRPLWLLAVLLAALPARAGNKETAGVTIPQVPALTAPVGAPSLSINAANLGAPMAFVPGPGYVGYDAALHALPAAQSPAAHQSGRDAILAAIHETLQAQPQAREFTPDPYRPQEHEIAAFAPTGRQLRRALREGEAFDGAQKKEEPTDEGVWRDSRIQAAALDAPVAETEGPKEVSKTRLTVAAAHGVPLELARKLGRLEGLDETSWRKLLKQAASAKIKMDQELPFSQAMSVSLELEFRLAKNLTDADIKEPALIKAWNETGELPSEDWRSISKKKMRAIRRARPAGWDDEYSEGDSFTEMRTKPRGRKYYSNKPRHWDELARGLQRVQDQMPHGFYSVHGHFGREGRDLEIDTGAFARFVSAYEAPLRALAGRGWTLPKGSLDGGLGRLTTAKEGWTGHSDPFNVSDTYPTIEIKVLDGLADKGGKAHFDTKNLLKDLYFAFALVDRFKDGQGIPLVELGVPSTRGEKPSPLQQQRFLDGLYGDDVLGKAIALQRLAGLADAAPAMDAAALAEARARKIEIYQRLGLGVIFEIHESAGGYDPRWRQALLADGAKGLRRLVAELPQRSSLPAIFPADFVPIAQLAVSDLAEGAAMKAAQTSLASNRRRHSSQRTSLWVRFVERAWDAWFTVETWLDRLFGLSPSPEPRLAGHEEEQP